ncbi:MAG: response regulator [Saprospiraceae bacterium]
MKNYQIVVIEDSPSDALFTKIALEEVDPTLEIAWLQDGEEAINFLFPNGGQPEMGNEYNNIKIILLDLNLPRYTGLEVLKKLKSHTETSPIPVVIFSSSEMKSGIEECIEAGAEQYIVKSIDFDKYTNAIKKVVSAKLVA